MQVQNISFTAKPIFIPRKIVGNDLKSRPYLYNEVMDILKKHKSPAVFSNEGIEVSSPSQKFLDKLKEFGISFQTKKPL